MKEISTVGLDLAKNVFQVHAIDAIDAAGAAIVRRQVRRAQVLFFFSRRAPCPIGSRALCRCALPGTGTLEARP